MCWLPGESCALGWLVEEIEFEPHAIHYTACPLDWTQKQLLTLTQTAAALGLAGHPVAVGAFGVVLWESGLEGLQLTMARRQQRLG